MKKKILSVLLMAIMFLPMAVFAEDEKTYEVPMDMMHFSRQPGKKSMGTNAINHTAKVVEKDGKAHYYLQLKPMEFMNLTGQLTNLFIYDGDVNSNRIEATKRSISEGDYNTEFSFVRNNLKETEILCAVWVDAMDQLSGGEAGSGAGEQKAYFTFDWSNAKEVSGGSVLDKAGEKSSEKKSTGTLDKIADKSQKKVGKEVTIKVNGKQINPATLPFVENNRTMVPVRFISEALGLKVGWDSKARVVSVGEDKSLVKLKIDSKEIQKADGTKVSIDSPAIVRSNRTFVPLRAIAEISGAKVDWDASTRTVSINK